MATGNNPNSASVQAAFARRQAGNTGLWLAGATTPTTPTTTPTLVGANGQPLVVATATPTTTPTTQVVQPKPTKVATQAPAVKGTYQQALPPNSVINPMPVVGQATAYVTAGATHITVVQLCNVAQAHGLSRGWACNLSGGTTGTKPPVHAAYQLYVNGNRHYVAVQALTHMLALIASMAK
jgi:hypothetical protein